MSAIDTFRSLKNAVLNFIGQGKDGVTPETPKADEDPQKTHEYIQQLFDEGLEYENNHFADTQHLRVLLGAQDQKGVSPEAHRMNCDRLAAGNLWDVIGHRNETPETKWKSEVVEGLTQRNLRIRGSYISSAWHDITITPNLLYMNDIFNQERMAIGWSDFIDEYRDIAQKYGVATARIFFEDDEDSGHVRVAVVKPGTLVRTPNSTSFSERDGCWYAVQGTMINDKQVKRFYPDVEDPISSTTISQKFNPAQTTNLNRGNYTHTKMFAKLECFMDDDTIEERPITPEEGEELTNEIEALKLGQGVKSKVGQNGKLHVPAKQKALQDFLGDADENTMSDEDALYGDKVISAFTANIAEHTDAMDSGDLASLGLQKKYPFGRYICSVGGKLAEDIPNPNEVPWRTLFEEVKNEKVYGRNDGRSDPEIYFHDEKAASKSLSQFQDTVTLSMPKRYRKIDDKMNKKTESQQEDNDPLRVGYYVTTPPISIEGKVSESSLEMRGVVVQKSERSQGINNITVGGEPSRQSSGFQTQLLQKQNETQVSGELDRNLRVSVENIVESMFGMYKTFYTVVRPYNIKGVKRLFNVARTLSEVQAVDENGQLVIVKNPKFEITARPFSNYPNRFETELAEIAQIFKELRDENNAPVIPIDAIYDVLAMKYPDAAPNGKWRKDNEIMKLGREVMQQMEQEQEAQQKEQAQMENAIKSIKRQAELAPIKEAMLPSKEKENEQRPPSESITFKDLPPDGQVQMARQAGIDISEDAVKKHIASQKPKPATPNKGE